MRSERREPAPDEEEDSSSEPTGRSIWSGTISFGLVSIPVSLRPAVREGRIAMRMLDEDGAPLSRRYYCPKDDKEVSGDHLVRGYEIEPDRFVQITDEELESVAPEMSCDIDLRLFVDAGQVDPIYFERSYFMMPDKQSNKAYRLLAETMQSTRKIGIATFVMHEREHLVAIIAYKGVMRAELMRFHDEVRDPKELELPSHHKTAARDAAKYEKAISALSEAHLSEDELRSRYNQRLNDLLKRKQKIGKDVVEVQDANAEAGEGRKVSDLMAELRKSLEKNQGEQQGSKRLRRSRAAADEDDGDRSQRHIKTHPGRGSSRSQVKKG